MMDVWIDYSLWIVCVLIYTFIIIRYGFPFIWKTPFSALTIRDQTNHKPYLSLIFKSYVDGHCVKTPVMLCEYSKSPPTTCSMGEIPTEVDETANFPASRINKGLSHFIYRVLFKTSKTAV